MPHLLISPSRARANIRRMAERAKRHGLDFLPHFKTHQGPVVADWCREYGAEAGAVTSFRMAEVFVEAGWRKLTVAMPLDPNEIEQLAKMSERSEISVFLVDAGVADQLARKIERPLPYFIEIDTGYGRSGVSWTDHRSIRAIISAAGQHNWRGFYVHSGHTYDAQSKEEIVQIHQQLLERIAVLKAAFTDTLEVVIGDTPACSTQEDFRGITGIGPGNFVYYDLVQQGLGACQMGDIATCGSLNILQVKNGGKELVVHGGWAQLGKDSLEDERGKYYGLAVPLVGEDDWEHSRIFGRVTKLSQEHGTIVLNEPQGYVPGDRIGVLPVHACAAVAGARIAWMMRGLLEK
ncbi:MAG: alanine racemase [Bacteroidota bacterium]